MLRRDPGSIRTMNHAPRLRKTFIIVVSLLTVLSAGVFIYWSVSREAEQALNRERGALELERAAAVNAASSESRLDASAPEGWLALVSVRNAHDLAFYDGGIHVASDGGIVVYHPSGEVSAHYTHFNGLPDDRVSSLAVRGDALYAGTAAGLARIRAGGITSWNFGTDSATSVTCLQDAPEGLYIGTRGAGLMRFDGSAFQRVSRQFPGGGFTAVTAVAVWNGQVVAGTWNDGLYILRGAAWAHVGEKEGLSHAHVTGLSAADDLLVATSGGLDRVDEALRVRRLEPPMMAGAVLRLGADTYTGTLDGTVYLMQGSRRRALQSFGSKLDPQTVNRIVAADNRVWALTSAGSFRIDGERVEPFGKTPAQSLADSFVSALALDGNGNIWIGYFDDGVEVLGPDLASLRRFTEPECRTVKCLTYDPQDGSIYLGGSKGLVRFHRDLRRDLLTRDDGLINNEVNGIRRMNSRLLVAATGGGLSLIESGRIRSLYAFHGLVNNRVFALQPVSGGTDAHPTYAAGTLGGISLVQDGRITGSITPENSPLPIHWITALAGLDGGLLIGTYGGGLAWQAADGSWTEMPPALRSLEINPNAILVSDKYVLAGTLDRGIAVLRRSEGRWELLRDRLGSPNVTALAEDASRFYIGTDNGLLVVQKGNL